MLHQMSFWIVVVVVALPLVLISAANRKPRITAFSIRRFGLQNSSRNPSVDELAAPSSRSSQRWNFETLATGVLTRHGVISWEEFWEKFWWVTLLSTSSTAMARKFRPKFRPILRQDLCPSHKICRRNFALGNVRRNDEYWIRISRIELATPILNSQGLPPLNWDRCEFIADRSGTHLQRCGTQPSRDIFNPWGVFFWGGGKD